MDTRRRRQVVFVGIAALNALLLLLFARARTSPPAASPPTLPSSVPSARAEAPARIGYFHGGRTGIAFRAYVNGYFEQQGVAVDFYTRNLRSDELYVLPHEFHQAKRMQKSLEGTKSFGKVDGETLIDDVVAGRVDGACVGEASFLLAVDRGEPVVAVASLGHDRLGEPGHAIIFRTGVSVKSSADLRGKVLISRRAGPGDETLLREFVRSEGLDPDRDVVLRSKVDDDEYIRAIRNGECDGGYFHMLGLRPLVIEKKAWIYRRLDWVTPTVVQSLLVFRRDWVETHRDEVARIVTALVIRVRDEKGPQSGQRINGQKGERIDLEFEGMNLPDVDLPPLIRIDMLTLMQQMLMRNRLLGKAADVTPFIDNGFVEAAWRQVSGGTRGTPSGNPRGRQ